MENETENANSQTSENDELVLDTVEEEDITVLKEKFEKLSDDNKKLYARTKKAEGFELRDGKWVKPITSSEPQVKTETKPEAKSGELGYAEEAYLLANDIKKDEISLAQEVLKKTGMNLRDLIDDDYFKSKLKTFREEKASLEAVPKGTKRSSPSPRDSVDYWAKKPFAEVPEDMRIAVVNARLEKEKSKNPFATI